MSSRSRNNSRIAILFRSLKPSTRNSAAEAVDLGHGLSRSRDGSCLWTKNSSSSNQALDFYTPEDRELILGENALRIWKFPKGSAHATQ